MMMMMKVTSPRRLRWSPPASRDIARSLSASAPISSPSRASALDRTSPLLHTTQRRRAQYQRRVHDFSLGQEPKIEGVGFLGWGSNSGVGTGGSGGSTNRGPRSPGAPEWPQKNSRQYS